MLKNTFYPTVFMTVALLVFALLVVPHALAVTFTVNSTLDQPDDLTIPDTCHTADNTCTLRAAVMQANRTSGAGATIIVPAGIYTLTISAAGLDGEENGDLNLTTPTIGNPVITIIGAGASTTIIDANTLDRVFGIDVGRTAIITGVTIRNGYSPSRGGGIYSGGTLTVTNSTIAYNQAVDFGGGIYSLGPLTVTNSTISGNPTGSSGGGIYSGGTLTVTNSTISGNPAGGSGGGIFNLGPLTVTNSTISSNQAGFNGGGIFNISPLTVTNSTISGNHGNNGGGIYNGGNIYLINTTISHNDADTDGGGIYNGGIANVYNTSIVSNGADADRDANGGSGGGVYNVPGGATFNLRNTLVAGNNVANAPIYDDCTGTLNSFGRNLFWEVSGCTVSGSWAFLNSLQTLGPLQNNGGPTWTRALLLGSNAIDGGDPVQGCVGPDSLPLATDQRGAARVVDVSCDIGAFEYGAHVSQSIQFGPISNKTLADSPFVITAASSSDLPVDFSTNTPSVCTVTSGPLIANVSSATVVLSRGGTCTLVAQQPGNQIFNPALAVTQTFNLTGSKTFLPLIMS